MNYNRDNETTDGSHVRIQCTGGGGGAIHNSANKTNCDNETVNNITNITFNFDLRGTTNESLRARLEQLQAVVAVIGNRFPRNEIRAVEPAKLVSITAQLD